MYRAEPVLLMHCEGADEGTTFTDNSPVGHTLVAAGSAKTDDAEKYFGSTSANFSTGSCLISGGASYEWTLATDYTVDLFVKHTATADVQTYVLAYDSDNTHSWRIYKDGSHQLKFAVMDNATPVVSLNSTATLDTNWHHVAICKVGIIYGLYIDGTQVAYSSDVSTLSLAVGANTKIYLGANYNIEEMNGWLDEIRICKTNAFKADPVAGLTNTIQVPNTAYPSWS